MKQIKIVFHILFIFMVLSFLLISLSGISIAEQANKQKCIHQCNEKKSVCLNTNVDKRICEVESKSCLEICESQEESPATLKKEPDETAKPM